MRTSLVLITAVLAACSSSEAQPTPKAEAPQAEAPETVEAPRPAEAPRPVEPPVAKPVRAPLPLTRGSSHIKVGLRMLETLANTIDTAGGDCIALARALAPMPKEIAKARDRLAEHGQQFKTLPLSAALRERVKDQRALLVRCKQDEPLAKTAIARSLGVIREYDFAYEGSYSGSLYP